MLTLGCAWDLPKSVHLSPPHASTPHPPMSSDCDDATVAMPYFAALGLAGGAFGLSFLTPTTMSPALRTFVFGLTKENMYDIEVEHGFGYDEAAWKAVLYKETGRYLIVNLNGGTDGEVRLPFQGHFCFTLNNILLSHFNRTPLSGSSCTDSKTAASQTLPTPGPW